jgi:hypothetical protein
LVAVSTKGGTGNGQLFIGYPDSPSAIRAFPETKIAAIHIILNDRTMVVRAHLVVRSPSADGTQMAVGIPEDSRVGFQDTFNIIVENYHCNADGFLEELGYAAPDNHDDL